MRIDGWEKRLDNVIENSRKKSFSWGDFDCFTFAADVTDAVAGVDFMAGYRGEYCTPMGAYRMLNRHGGFDEAFTGVMISIGARMASPLFAKRGDLIVCDNIKDKYRIGVCYNGRVICPFADGGLHMHSIPKMGVAWTF